jgi:hypothetical protein
VIQHDVAFTVSEAPAHSAANLSLVAENRALRKALAAVIRAGDRAARGAQVVAVQGHVVVFVGAEKWQELRRAMIAAGNKMLGQRGQVN